MTWVLDRGTLEPAPNPEEVRSAVALAPLSQDQPDFLTTFFEATCLWVLLRGDVPMRLLGCNVMMMMRNAGNVMVVGMMGMMKRLGVSVMCARHTCAEHHRSGG